MKYLEIAILAILSVFAPIKAVLVTTLVLVIADTVAGIIAAHKRGEPITSTGFKRTVGKALLYESALCLAFLCENYLIGSAVPACKMVSAMIGLVELKSILENLNSISGNNLFKSIIDKLVQKESEKS